MRFTFLFSPWTDVFEDMETKPLGKTGLSVSQIGLGMAALGRPGYINLGHGEDFRGQWRVDEMRMRAFQMLDFAWLNGVRYFDTARSYGKGEEFLAEWADSQNHDDFVVGSKWGYTYTAGWQVQAEYHEIKEHSLPKLLEQYKDSQALLGGHLALYQIHSATLESKVLDNPAILHQLSRMKADGIRIGLSVSGPRQSEALVRAMEITIDGVRLFDSMQATFNVFEQQTASVLAQAWGEGIGIIVKEALANGRLTTRNSHQPDQDALRLLKGEATRLGATLDALAIAYVLAQPFVDTVLSGAATPSQLSENLGANAVAVDAKAMTVMESLQESPKAYWDRRKSLAWN